MSAQGKTRDLEETQIAYEQRQAQIDMEVKRIFDNEAQAKANTKKLFEYK